MYDVPTSRNRRDHADRTGEKGVNYEPCAVCGKAIDTTRPHWRASFHCGGWTAVTEEEREALNQQGRDGEDMGTWPVGPDCRKRLPELARYCFYVTSC